MSSHDVKLVLTDVDGTILPAGKHVVSERLVCAIHNCARAGIRVGAASGRDSGRLARVFDDDPVCTSTMLATNGMEVFLDGELVLEKQLSRTALESVMAFLANKANAGFVAREGLVPKLLLGEKELLAQVLPEYAKDAVRGEKLPLNPIVKAFVFTKDELEFTQALRQDLRNLVGELDFTLPAPGVIGIVPKGWSKADGVSFLLDRLRISEQQIIVCGDSDNDIEMLSAYPNSYAVANASKEAALAAKYHIGSCEDDAVAQLLESLIS